MFCCVPSGKKGRILISSLRTTTFPLCFIKSFPFLILSGEEDKKYVALARQMATILKERENAKGSCHVVECRGGHAVHLECPMEVLTAISTFLESDN
jgi:pimeloyl-ACP methyl ester carboxylesterase